MLKTVFLVLWFYEGFLSLCYAVQGEISTFVTHAVYMIIWAWLIAILSNVKRGENV